MKRTKKSVLMFSFSSFSTFLVLSLFIRVIELKKCDIYTTIMREVENEGFHRKLNSLVEVVNVHSNIDNCKLILLEEFPSSIYVNPDELNELARQKKIFAKINYTIDVEAPESSASPFAVTVFATENHVQHNLLSAHFSLPFHIRYHKPQTGVSFQQFFITKPTLLIHCSKSFQNILGCNSLKKHLLPCNYHGSKLCEWHELSYKTNAENLPIHVPVGNTNHTFLVTIITFLVTSAGCVCILYSLLITPTSNSNQR